MITAVDILKDFEDCAKDPIRYFELRRLAQLRWTPPELLIQMQYPERLQATKVNEEFEEHLGRPNNARTSPQ